MKEVLKHVDMKMIPNSKKSYLFHITYIENHWIILTSINSSDKRLI